MRQLIRNYYNVVKVTKELQLGINTDAVVRINGLGIINGWVQIIEDNAVKKNNNPKDFNRASNIVYIGQPMVMDFKNLAALGKLINNAKYQRNNIKKSI